MKRIVSVDTVRCIAIMAVISIHTAPFAYIESGGELYFYLSVAINQVARFAVPFFFVISGYFWGVKLSNSPDQVRTTQELLKRVLIILVGWSLIFLLPYNFSAMVEYGLLDAVSKAYQNLIYFLQNPAVLLLQGTSEHLWFLVSLVLSIAICHFFVQQKAFKLLIFISVLLYVIGVLLNSYALTPIGSVVDFNTRNGPFFSTVFIASGYFLSRYDPDFRWFYYGGALFIFGCVIHFSEIIYLNKNYGTFIAQDFVFGTFFMGIGVAVMSLSNHWTLKIRIFGNIGKMTLGIYAIHVIFIELLRPLDAVLTSPLWEISFVFIVLLLSVISTYVLSKFKFTKRIVL
jgi:surface polysaccharide O-acyltransferase-like enzyme